MGAQAGGSVTGEPKQQNRYVFPVFFVIGWTIIGIGLWQIFSDSAKNTPGYTFGLALGTNIVHDVVVAPAICLFGYFVTRLVPGRHRAAVGWGLFTSALVLLIGAVPISGFGKKPDNPTLLPLDYLTATVTVLGVVWVIAAICIVIVERRHRRVEQ